MKTTELYIFDLDGTLVLTDHRTPLLTDKTDRQRWRKFYAACVDDQPNTAVIATMEGLRSAGAEIRIFTGRSDEVRAETVAWLRRHTDFEPTNISLVMRQEGDHTPDHELKHLWWCAMRREDRARLVAVFEDRKRVVDMWRRCQVPCFHVAEGDF